jgi:hypothetical protein
VFAVVRKPAAYDLDTVFAMGAQGDGVQCALGLNGVTPAGSE